jgi:hypothetical protein
MDYKDFFNDGRNDDAQPVNAEPTQPLSSELASMGASEPAQPMQNGPVQPASSEPAQPGADMSAALAGAQKPYSGGGA